jgi:hypothetical protein
MIKNESTLRGVAKNMAKRVHKWIDINGYYFQRLL